MITSLLLLVCYLFFLFVFFLNKQKYFLGQASIEFVVALSNHENDALDESDGLALQLAVH
jgi:hypothetical protein